jgi:hypothetical protein
MTAEDRKVFRRNRILQVGGTERAELWDRRNSIIRCRAEKETYAAEDARCKLSS